MMREFNGGEHPIVLNTYQCYLKDSRFRLNADIESARRQGYSFGAKLVRGAYMARPLCFFCSELRVWRPLTLRHCMLFVR
jgi:Proline dehydrogenase